MDAEAVQDELPHELLQLIELKKLKDQERIDALSAIVAKRRDEAVEARRASGIEKIWDEDDEYYVGVDDLNRATATYTKALSPSGGLTSNKDTSQPKRCTAFFNITRQFVDSAAARMGDILLPAGEWNYKIKPTPIPDMDRIAGSNQPVISPNGGVALNDDGTPYTLGQFHAEESAEADAKVKKAEKRINDWHVECKFKSESRKVIEYAARIGTGIMRGPYPNKVKSRMVKGGALVIKETISPASKCIDPRNFFPDPACGDNIQNGSYTVERDPRFTARQLRDLKGVPGYISANIDKVLKEGPGKKYLSTDGFKPQVNPSEDDCYELWTYHGLVDIDDLKAMGAVEEDDDGADLVPAVIVMVNDTAIKAHLNPLDTGEFPYDVMAWQRIPGSIWGVGVSRQGRTSQEMLNASCRAMMDNAGASAGLQFFMRQGGVIPQNGEWRVTPNKFWYVTAEMDGRPVSDAFSFTQIPSIQAEMKGIIDLAYKQMEDATGVSFLLQGQQGSAPDTVGGMTMLHQNASALLRRIARVYDESVTEPHVRRYYDWLLMHGEDDEKGDFQIEAIGSTALVEREIQAQQAQQILQMALNPTFGYSPKKAADELLRAWRFEPSKFEMDEKEKQQAEQAAQGQVAPAVQAAQIRTQGIVQAAQIRAEADMAMDKSEMDRDLVFQQSVTNRDQMTYEARMAELQVRERLAMMEYANRHQLKLEDVKSSLAETAMKLKVQKELNGTQALTPPVEPAGRAPDGQAFAK